MTFIWANFASEVCDDLAAFKSASMETTLALGDEVGAVGLELTDWRLPVKDVGPPLMSCLNVFMLSSNSNVST